MPPIPGCLYPEGANADAFDAMTLPVVCRPVAQAEFDGATAW